MVDAETFKEVCDRVERSTVYGAADALRELLSGEMDVPHGEITWKALSGRIEVASHERRWELKEAGHLVALLRNRARREDRARGLDQESFELYRRVENRSPRELATYIAQNFRIRKMPPAILNGPKWDKPVHWDRLLNFVRAMRPWGLTSADSLYSVLLFMRAAERHKPTCTHDLFTRCSLCWRPVPSRFMGKSRILCQFHNYRKEGSVPPHKKMYERGSRIANASGGRKRADIEESLHALVGKNEDLMSLWEKDWFSLWSKDPCQARDALEYACEWPDQAGLNAVISNVIGLIPGQGTSPAELLDLLVPMHPMCDDIEKEAMTANHEIWLTNFRLFIPELAHAESWLEACIIKCHKIHFPG